MPKKKTKKPAAKFTPAKVTIVASLRIVASYLRDLNQSVYEDTVKMMKVSDQRIQLSDIIDNLADLEEESRC